MNDTTPQPESQHINVNAAEAAAALEEIARTADRTRRAIAQGPASTILIFWGTLWAIGYALTEFRPEISGTAWLILDVGGGIASFLIGILSHRPSSSRGDARIGLFWLALFGYALLWLWILHPSNGNRTGAYFATVPMFGYVIAGLWLSRFFVILGLLVTALTVVGLLFFNEHFNLWMSLIGGGSLIVAGVFIRKTWR